MHGAKSHYGRIDSIFLLAELYNQRLNPSELGAPEYLLEAAVVEIFPAARASGQRIADQWPSWCRYRDLVPLPPAPDARLRDRSIAIALAACRSTSLTVGLSFIAFYSAYS